MRLWDGEALTTRWLGHDDDYHHVDDNGVGGGGLADGDDDDDDKVGWPCVCVPALSSHLLGVAHVAQQPHSLVHQSAATSTSKASIFRERCSVLVAQFFKLDLNKLCRKMSSACSVLVLPVLAEQCG